MLPITLSLYVWRAIALLFLILNSNYYSIYSAGCGRLIRTASSAKETDELPLLHLRDVMVATVRVELTYSSL